MSGKVSALIALLVFISLTSAGQNTRRFRHLTINNGLAHTDATCFEQDSIGFIWIGTNSGLQRFDGRELKSFLNETSRFFNVYNNRITALKVMGDMLWVGSEGGLAAFSLRTEKYLIMRVSGDISAFDQLPVDRLEICAGSLWLISGTALYRFSPDPLTGEVFSQSLSGNIKNLPESFSKADVLSLRAIGANLLCIGTSEGLIILRTSGNEVEYIGSYIIKSSNSLSSTGNIDNIFLKEGRLWLMSGLYFQVVSFDKNETEIRQVIKSFSLDELLDGLDNNVIFFSGFVIDDNENLWCSSSIGLIFVDAPVSEQPSARIFKNSKCDQYSVGGYNLSSLMIDRTNCLWVGSWGGGASYLDLEQKKFNLLSSSPEDLQISLRGSFVRAIAEDNNGLIWIGLRDEGINIFDPETGVCHTLEDYFGGAFRMFNDEIRSLKVIGEKVFAGTTSDLSIFNLRDRTTTRIGMGMRDDQISPAAIFSIESDSFGQIWLATWGAGINRIRFIATGYEILKLTSEMSNSIHLSSNIVTNLFFDEQKNEILASTARGLNRILLDDKGGLADIIIYHLNETDSSFSSEYLWPLVKENDSVYWVGTLGGGLNRVVLSDERDANNFGTYRAMAFTITEGAPSNDIESIQIDNRGNLWLGSRGISMFSPKQLTFWNFDINDGLQSNGFKIGASCRSVDGSLYFGGINGLNFFHPADIKANAIKPIPVLSDIRIHNQDLDVGELINNRIILEEAIHYTESIELKHIENDFSLVLSSLHFANAEKCRFRYILDGYDSDWNLMGGDYPVVNYSNLDYGRYTFRMNASNSDGNWSDHQVELEISVMPPWWRTDLAYVSYSLLILMVFYGILYYAIRWIRLRNNLKIVEAEEKRMEEMHQMKMQFFTNISHEFRTPLTLILSPAEKLISERTTEKEQKKLLALINNNANRLLHLVNELMDFRKAETGKMPLHAQKLEVREFICSICQGFTTLAKQKQIRMTFIPGLSPEIWADGEMMSKIIYNLFSNAVKYTSKGGTIEVEILEGSPSDLTPLYPNKYEIVNDSSINTYCFIRVKDTGMGISEGSISHIFERYYQVNMPSERHLGTGVGLALLKSLVSIHHGYILVSSERYLGTEIVVGFPTGCQHLKPEEILSEASPGFIGHGLSDTGSKAANVEETPTVNNEPGNNDDQSTLLIVEDNEELRTMLAEHFSIKHKVVVASEGQEGFEVAVREVPYLIISDVMMPVMDGFEMIKLLKQDIRTSHIPIVLLSARTSIESQLEGIELGAVEYIPKPFNLKLLDLKINQFLLNLRNLKKRYSTEVFASSRDLIKSEKDQKFMEEMLVLIDRNIDNSNLSIDVIASELGIGRSNLYKKVKSLTDQTLGDFIRTFRLKKAARILLSEDVNVSEVIYRVGINSHSYFTKSFKAHFNMTPSEFIMKNKTGK
jgi:signal transduction histidine kinase/DNA-binding response OmpR family regulator/ligand-binding sensor domain-containing protein